MHEFPYSSAPERTIDHVQFGILGPDEIRRMSVAEIRNEKPYEAGQPVPGGIADRRLGANGHSFPCATCASSDSDCPGHFGHVELAKPMYNIGFIKTTLSILRCVCYYCSRLMVTEASLVRLLAISKPQTRLRHAMKYSSGTKKVCTGPDGCGNLQPKFYRDGFRIRMDIKENEDDEHATKQSLSAERAHAIFKRISDRHSMALGLDPKWVRPEYLILTVLPVPPLQVRPSVTQGGLRNEDDLTNKLSDILKNNNSLRQMEATGAVAHLVREQLDLVQYHIATYMNNELPGVTQSTVCGGSRAIKSIGQRFKGKEGRVRGNLMGKRVDFSARTVITPDPNLRLHEVGVPYSIAKNLTFPEVVTSHNYAEMRRLVDNGPTEYPGALLVERDDGRKINLSYIADRTSVGLEIGFTVIRHIKDGDYVLFNRQPSLHKMSIMGHRIRVLPYSTFRLNLSVTSPYNADFDGDEMNLHVPQSHQTRAEVQELMLVPHCIVSPQGNKPVMGIVQDTLLGCMHFTQRDTFLERDLTMNLLLHVGDWDGVVPEPAIYKPKPLWTGKQIFSLVLPSVSLIRYSITHPDTEKEEISPGDTKVYISRGNLISGVVDKKTVGSSANGLIHVTWKEFGPRVADMMISQIQVLVNHYVLQRGQSIGIGDTIADDDTMSNVISTIKGAKEEVKLLIKKAQERELVLLPGKGMMESFETEVNKVLNGARDKSGSSAQSSLLKSNNLKRMVSAGSKGSFINISQICACVGQQNVEGKRISYGFRGRTLPHFATNDLGPESRGFVENSYLRGLTPSEFFFHAMGGREGLIDTAVKTAETGYIQRRLIKAMEDVNVRYDGTVRNSANHIVEFLYGEDGMDATFLEDQKLRTLSMSDAKLREEYLLEPTDPSFGKDANGASYLKHEACQSMKQDPEAHILLRNEYAQIREDRDLLRNFIAKNGEAKRPLPVNVERVIWNAKQMYNIKPDSESDLTPIQVVNGMKMLMKRLRVIEVGDDEDDTAILDAEGRDENGEFVDRKPRADPLRWETQQNATLIFQIHLRAMLACKRVMMVHRLGIDAFLWMLGEIEHRFLDCRVAPGENIGAIAAQSIGEPATQMTLNTFHYAGVSAKNVTLGVPRLREIINVSKHTKTPSLTVYLKKKYSMDKGKAKEIQASLQHTTLYDVLMSTEIYYDPNPTETVIEDDRELVTEYFEIEEPPVGFGPWLLRLTLDKDMLQDRVISMDHIENVLNLNFGQDVHIIRSTDNASKLVMRIRVSEDSAADKAAAQEDDTNADVLVSDDAEQNDDTFLRRFEQEILMKMPLGGIEDIKKVFMRQSKRQYIDKTSGTYQDEEEWVLDTDGVNLKTIMCQESVDHTRTISNDIVEIFETLGIEAVREALLNEIRGVISFDGAYVNYRHLAILVDVMTYRGHLMSITRHGINRVDSGPLMKCSFEETTDILLEAAVYGMKDGLHGVSENIMLGQLAPIGTGSFKMVLNEKMLQQVIAPEPVAEATEAMGEQTGPSSFDMAWSPARGDATPGPRSNDPSATPGLRVAYSPAVWNTPNRMGSSRSVAAGQQFSPSADGAAFSPITASPTGSGQTAGSFTPIQSPGRSFVQPMSPGGTSPYMPSPGRQSPGYSIAPSPGYAASPGQYNTSFAPSSPAYKLTSPAYGAGYASPAAAQSPGGQYSPTSPGFSPTSPAYSPSATGPGRPGTAAYSPTSPNYNAAASPGYGGGINYSPASPHSYSPNSPAFSPRSPGAHGYSPSTPQYTPQGSAANGSANQNSPASPQYSPASPQYSPR